MILRCKKLFCGEIIPGKSITCPKCDTTLSPTGSDKLDMPSDKAIRTLAIMDQIIASGRSLSEVTKDISRNAKKTALLNLIIPGLGYIYCSRFNGTIFFSSIIHGIAAFLGVIIVTNVTSSFLAGLIFAIACSIHGYFYSNNNYEALGHEKDVPIDLAIQKFHTVHVYDKDENEMFKVHINNMVNDGLKGFWSRGVLIKHGDHILTYNEFGNVVKREPA